MSSGEYNPEIDDEADGIPMPERKSYYRSAFWGGFSGHVRGMASGIASGGLIGGLVGIPVAAVAVGVFGMAITGLGAVASFAAIAGGFAAAGTIAGMGLMGMIGTVAGAAAGVEDEKQRRLEKAITKTQQRQMALAAGMTPQQFEALKGNEQKAKQHTHKKQFFSWKVGLIGMGMGALVGVALAATGAAGPVLALLGIAEGAAHGAFTMAAFTHAAAICAPVMAAIGLSFGVDCGVFRKITTMTDGIFRCKQNAGAASCLPCEKHPSKALAPAHLPAQLTNLTDEEKRRLQTAQIAAISHQERINTTTVSLAGQGRA